MEGGLVQVALQGEVAEGFPRWLVGLHLHGIPLHGVVVADGTACHQRCARQALQVLEEQRKACEYGSVMLPGHFRIEDVLLLSLTVPYMEGE